MTENKWLDFAGFLNGCRHKLEHDDCPYKKYAQMDQYQRLEIMLTISDEQADQMINSCSKLMIHCNSTVIYLEKSKCEVAAI